MRMLVLCMLRFGSTVVLLDGMIGSGVVFVLVNLPARIILLPVYLCAFLRCEPAAIRGAVVVHFAVDVRLAIFQVAALARSQLPGPLSVRDTCLLVCFADIRSAHRGNRGPAMIL